MDVGEVRVAEDADFKRLKSLCDETDGWKQEYNKNNTTVSTKINELSDFQMVKVRIFNIFKFVLTVISYAYSLNKFSVTNRSSVVLICGI